MPWDSAFLCFCVFLFENNGDGWNLSLFLLIFTTTKVFYHFGYYSCSALIELRIYQQFWEQEQIQLMK